MERGDGLRRAAQLRPELPKKGEEHLASAEDNLAVERHNPAAGDAIHASISSKDAIVTSLTGTSSKGKDHTTAAKELKQALGTRKEAVTAQKASP